MLNKISKSLNFAIIGGGPAGFFCAKKLLKKSDNSKFIFYFLDKILFFLINSFSL